MSAGSENKVFISWSGSPSKEIATELRSWLHHIFDEIEAFVSDVDIEAGSRSMVEIENALKDAKVGIIVTTKENMQKPWLNFEAGALSKEVGERKNRVIPLLIDFDRMTDLEGPMNILQACMFNEEGMTKLLKSLYVAFALDEGKAEGRIDAYWPKLEEIVQKILERHEETASKTATALPVTIRSGYAGSDSSDRRSQDSIMSEMLAILRELRDDKPTVAKRVYSPGNGTRNSGDVRRIVTDWVERYASPAELFKNYAVRLGVNNDGRPAVRVLVEGPLAAMEKQAMSDSLASFIGIDDVRVTTHDSFNGDSMDVTQADYFTGA